MADERDPVEQLLELTVYAPVGLFLLAREQLPALVERGRGQAVGQVRLARFIGQFAVAKGRQELEKRLRPAPASAPAAAPASGPAPAAPRVEEVVVVVDDAAPVAPVVAAVGPLPIDGYDALAASQVLPRLAALTSGDLEQVRRYEVAHRNRRTVLARIAQLQAAG